MTRFTAKVQIPVEMIKDEAIQSATDHIGKELKLFGAQGSASVIAAELVWAPVINYDPRPPEKQVAWRVELTVQMTADIAWPSGTYSVGNPLVRPV